VLRSNIENKKGRNPGRHSKGKELGVCWEGKDEVN